MAYLLGKKEPMKYKLRSYTTCYLTISSCYIIRTTLKKGTDGVQLATNLL